MLFLINRSYSKNLSSSLFSISGSTFTKRTKLLSRNSCIFVPACGMRRFTMAGMTKKTVQQATPTTNSNSNSSTSTNVQNSTVSSPMSNSNSNVSSSMSNSSYTVPSPMSSSSSTTSSSNSNSSSSLLGSVANYVANITHPNNYLHTSKPSNNFTTSTNNFTTSTGNQTINSSCTAIVPIDQVTFPPLRTIICGDTKIMYNEPTYAVFMGEKKSRECFVSQLVIEKTAGKRVTFPARMFTHSSGRLDANGEYQYHEYLGPIDIDFLNRIQYFTELRYCNSEQDFRLLNFSERANEKILIKGYSRTKDLTKISTILLQDPKIADNFLATGKLDTNVSPLYFKQLAANAIKNDPTFFT